MCSMYKRVSISVILLFSIITITSCHSDDTANAHLLSIPVTGTEPYSVNILTDKISTTNDSDTQNSNAYEVLIQLIYHDKANDSLISIKQINYSGHIIYKAVLIFNEIPDDDSISGYRYDIILRNEKNKWQLIDITRSFRCWPDRGHRVFSVAACL